MGFKIQKTFASLISLAFLATNFAVVNATDIKSHWANEVVSEWIDQGLISGYEDGTFRPDNAVKRAEFVSFANRVLKMVDKSQSSFSDVPAQAWYSEDILKSVEAGIIKGYEDGVFKPEEPITREEAVVVLNNAFELDLDEGNSADNFVDSSEIASWAKSSVGALYKKGYIKGRIDNRFAPKENITRAETIAMLNNIMDTLINTKGEFTNSVEGNLLINTEGVVLKNMKVEGDLFLAQGIGEGDVTLDGVTVEGRVIVKGGGSNSIIFKDSKVNGNVVVNKKGNKKVRIMAQGQTYIPSVKLKSPAKLQEYNVQGKGFEVVNVGGEAQDFIELEGDFETVAVEIEGAKVDVINGKVEKLTVQKEAGETKVTIAEGAEVATLNIAAKTIVSGKGTITNATIDAKDVVIETQPVNVLVSSTGSATVGGKPAQSTQNSESGSSGTSNRSSGGSLGGTSEGSSNTPAQSPTIEPSIVAVIVNSSPVYGIISDSGSSATIDLSDRKDSEMISAMSIETEPSECSIYVKSVTSPVYGKVDIKKEVDNINHISVSSLLGTGRKDIGIGTIRLLFGESVTIKGILKKDGHKSKEVSLKIKL